MFTRKEKGVLEENKRENKVLTSTSNRIGSQRTSTLGVHPLLGDLASRTRKRNQGSDGQAKTYYFGRKCCAYDSLCTIFVRPYDLLDNSSASF
jgi:hypothetical protein